MNDFDRILDDCLARMSAGASTLEDCLTRHPDHAAQLRPLLQTASRLERAGAARPSPAFKARARARLTLHMQAHPRRKTRTSSFLRVAFSAAVFLLAFLVAGSAAAQAALPGDPLYGWKLTGEQVWRATASDPLVVDLALASRRADEMLAVSGDPAAYSIALEEYQKALARLTSEADAEAQERIRSALSAQQEAFAEAGIAVPELDTYLGSQTPVEDVAPVPSSIPPTVIPTFAPTGVPTPTPTIIIPTVIPTLPVPTVEVPPLPLPTVPIPPLP
ncbi:MAG: hypothetical protein AB1750_01260 [Chloroflexota bacterium]